MADHKTGSGKLPPGFEHLGPEALKELAALTYARSSAFRAIYSNLYRTRAGVNELTIILSKVTHAPSLNVFGNILEEEVEVAMGWPQIKMLSQTLAAIVATYEQEIGEIKIPTNFVINLEGQRKAIRSLGIASDPKK